MSTSEEIDSLRTMDLTELRKRFLAVLGRPTNSADKDALIEKITKKLAFGGKIEPLPKRAGRPVSGKPGVPEAKPADAKKAETKRARRNEPSPFAQDPRLPAPGSTIRVAHKKKDYECRYLGAEGFEYEGERFRSLSAVASKILGGVAVNGYLWWGLITRPAAKPAAETPGPKASAPAKRGAARAARKASAKKGKK